MILPIVAYGSSVLTKEADNVPQDHPNLKELIQNMFETMDAAKGVGLAAPQIGLPLRLFVVDASPFAEDDEKYAHLKDFRKVFINPEIEEFYGDDWTFEEGCLSIPTIREDVDRPEGIKMTYFNEHFEKKTEEFDDIVARIIQHEYDHIEGVLFVDYLSPLKKRFLKKKLASISKGNVNVSYKMKFPLK